VSGERYEIRFQAAACRAIAERLPESVAAAVLEFCEATLALSPRRVGKPLFGPLAGCHGARRGTYRIVYRIHEQAHAVQVLDIDHRADIYRRPLRLWNAKVCPERKVWGSVARFCLGGLPGWRSPLGDLFGRLPCTVSISPTTFAISARRAPAASPRSTSPPCTRRCTSARATRSQSTATQAWLPRSRPSQTQPTCNARQQDTAKQKSGPGATFPRRGRSQRLGQNPVRDAGVSCPALGVTCPIRAAAGFARVVTQLRQA